MLRQTDTFYRVDSMPVELIDEQLRLLRGEVASLDEQIATVETAEKRGNLIMNQRSKRLASPAKALQSLRRKRQPHAEDIATLEQELARRGTT